MTHFNEYAEETDKTAVYPDAGEGTIDAVTYATMGLVGEAGEVANQMKKVLRDDNGEVTPERLVKIKKEIGDTLWYAARIARELDLDLDEIAESNIEKLLARMKSGSLRGDGDDR